VRSAARVLADKQSVSFVHTEFGRFRQVASEHFPLTERFMFECPGCGEWGYLNEEQWEGRSFVDHAYSGCKGGYDEAHDFVSALASGRRIEAYRPDLVTPPRELFVYRTSNGLLD